MSQSSRRRTHTRVCVSVSLYSVIKSSSHDELFFQSNQIYHTVSYMLKNT